MQPGDQTSGGDAGAEAEAFVPRGGLHGLRRRTGPVSLDSSPRSGRAGDGRRSTFREDVGHAAAETYLVTGFAFTLLGYLGVGYRWISQLIALLLYAVLLMPGFIKVGYYYFFSSQVCRSVVYGEQPRNRLDLYIPRDHNKSCPVVAFVTGGAWIIGYKAWGALLGRRLAERGIIVACIDYRNFPQGTISDMVTDASEGISFVCNNVVSFGGDPNKYNIQKLVDHFHERGLYRSIFLSIMEGEESLPLFSPEIVTKKSSAEAIALLPEIVLMHGTADYSIPSSASETFVDVLKHAGGKVKLQLYEGKTHTDVFLQDPLRGGRDQLVEDVISVIHADDAHAREKDALAPTPERLVYEWQLKLARQISPF